MTEHCHLYSFLIAHRFALSISQFCSKSDPNVSNSSSLRLASLSLSLSLSLRLMSLSQRSVLHSLFRSNQCLSFSGSLPWCFSLFLPCPSMVVVVGGCGSGGQLGLVVSRGVGLLIAWFWSLWVLVFWIWDVLVFDGFCSQWVLVFGC